MKPMVVTVPGNWNDDLPVGTLKSILRKAEMNES
jgi:predicted RNA binding protein YcfA (HicA-like mRNA interferase family)